jgi:hypothetical protein
MTRVLRKIEYVERIVGEADVVLTAAEINKKEVNGEILGTGPFLGWT